MPIVDAVVLQRICDDPTKGQVGYDGGVPEGSAAHDDTTVEDTAQMTQMAQFELV